jgi:hypothetical protein
LVILQAGQFAPKEDAELQILHGLVGFVPVARDWILHLL